MQEKTKIPRLVIPIRVLTSMQKRKKESIDDVMIPTRSRESAEKPSGIRKSQSKQEFRRPIVNNSKLPEAFRSNRKKKNPFEEGLLFLNSPVSAHTPCQMLKNKHLEPLFLKNQISPMKPILVNEYKSLQKESLFKRQHTDNLFDNLAFNELISVRLVKKSPFSTKKLVFHTKTMRFFLLEEVPIGKNHGFSKEFVEELQLRTKENAGYIQIYKIFWNFPEGNCSILKEYMTAGSLKDLLDFSLGLHEKALWQVLQSLLKHNLISENTYDPSKILFDKSGNAKYTIGLHPKQKEFSLEKLFFHCIFGLEEEFLKENYKSNCCFVHRILENPDEGDFKKKVLMRYSNHMRGILCNLIVKKIVPNKNRLVSLKGEGVEVVDLLKIACHWKDFLGKNRSFGRFLQGFAASLGNDSDDLSDVSTKISENTEFIKEISEFFLVGEDFARKSLLDLIKNI